MVVSAEPFHCTAAPDANPLPFKVSVNPTAPAVTEFGLKLDITGGAVTANGAAGDATGPGFATVIEALPADAIKDADTVAVS